MTSTSARKYSFGASFIDDNGETIFPELEVAKKIAMQEGYDEGYRAAKNEIEAETKSVLEKCSFELSQMLTQQQQAYEFIHGAVFALVAEINNKLFPVRLKEQSEPRIQKFVEDVLADLKNISKITFTVHTDLVTSVQQRIQEIQGQAQNVEVIVRESKELEKYECRATWDDGGIEYFPTKILESVDRAMKAYLQNVPVFAPTIETNQEETLTEGDENV